MKQLILIFLMAIFAIGVNAQSIVGKWKTGNGDIVEITANQKNLRFEGEIDTGKKKWLILKDIILIQGNTKFEGTIYPSGSNQAKYDCKLTLKSSGKKLEIKFQGIKLKWRKKII